MLKKLIASASAAAVALSSLSGFVIGAPVVTDPELIDAVAWAYDAGLTKYSDADAFMPYNNLTREQFAKFASEFAMSQLDIVADSSADCSFSDESSFDSTLAYSIGLACQQGLMLGSNGVFMAKQLVTRGQVATVVSRMLGEIDALSSEQAHFDYLNSIGVMNVANLNSAILRGDALLMLYRLANGGDEDLCAIDPTLPGCTTDPVDPTDPVVVKEGDLQISLNPSSPADMTSIPNNGVSKYATVDFSAGAKEISVNSVTLKRAGLGSYTNFNGGRLYFEQNGVRVSSRGNVSSDDIVNLTFVPALVVAAGQTVSVDLMAELSGAPTGAENKFSSTVIDSSAATVNGSIMTPTLRTAAYSVRQVAFTNNGINTTYQGGEVTNELGKFQLQNIGSSSTIDVLVKAITLRNVGNSNVDTSLENLHLLRAGNKVSTSTIVNGRDVTFVLADTIKDGQTATYTVNGNVVSVDNAQGDSYKFILRQSSDLNAVEATTSFRTSVSITTAANNDSLLTAGVYTVNGGELRFTRDTALALSQNVTRGSLQVEFMKGTIVAKQAILLETPTLNVLQGSAIIADFAKRYYLSIGNSTFSWSPVNGATSAQFDGSVTVNGTVPVRLYADVYSSSPALINNLPVQFGPLAYAAFTSSLGRIEYVSTQNAVPATVAVGSISSSVLSVIDASLSVTKYDSLGTTVYTSNNAQGKQFYGIRLSNNQSNDIKIGSITLTPANAAFNNGVSVNLKKGSEVLATRTLNGATTFNGLNIIVKKDAPVDLVFEGDFLSTIAGGQTSTFAVSFNAGDVIDNLTSNNVTVNGLPATSAVVNVIAGGSVIANANTVATAQGFAVPGEEKMVGSVNVQAINDELEVRALYVKITGLAGFAANAGNQLFNFKIKDAAGNVIATESSRDTQTNTSDIVKFTSFSASPKIAVGTSKVFNVYATVNTVQDAASAGEFSVALATSYNDPSYTDEYLGTRLYSVNAGTYVSATSSPAAVITTAALGNVLNVVAGYPKVSKIADGNATDLVTVKIQNPGLTNITVDQIQYFANAQNSADIAVPAKIFNGSTEIAAVTLVAGADTAVSFSAPITIAGGDSVTLLVKLNSPFVNTAATPVAGNRVFQVSNVRYSQTFANGSTSAFGFVPAGYTNTVGLPVAAANY